MKNKPITRALVFQNFADWGWECQAKPAALVQSALDIQGGTMPSGHMLGNGQAQTGASAGARAGFIYPVKAFCQARYVFRGNVNAGVFNAKYCLPLGGLIPK